MDQSRGMTHALEMTQMVSQEQISTVTSILVAAGEQTILGGITLDQFAVKLRQYRDEMERVAHYGPQSLRIDRAMIQLANLMTVELAEIILRLKPEQETRDKVLSGMSPQQMKLFNSISRKN